MGSPTLDELIIEIDKAIDLVTDWQQMGLPPGCQSFSGSFDGWRFYVTSYGIAKYDGACRNSERGLVLHLTTSQAKKAVECARRVLT